jgi:hypothetical protein
MKALELRGANRYQTIDEFQKALAVAGEPRVGSVKGARLGVIGLGPNITRNGQQIDSQLEGVSTGSTGSELGGSSKVGASTLTILSKNKRLWAIGGGFVTLSVILLLMVYLIGGGSGEVLDKTPGVNSGGNNTTKVNGANAVNSSSENDNLTSKPVEKKTSGKDFTESKRNKITMFNSRLFVNDLFLGMTIYRLEERLGEPTKVTEDNSFGETNYNYTYGDYYVNYYENQLTNLIYRTDDIDALNWFVHHYDGEVYSISEKPNDFAFINRMSNSLLFVLKEDDRYMLQIMYSDGNFEASIQDGTYVKVNPNDIYFRQ